ncbi:CPBP family intramembrane glutamic endopeptidase [Streptococcus dentiloxodontae]
MKIVWSKIKWVLVILGLIVVQAIPDVFQISFSEAGKTKYLATWQHVVVAVITALVIYFFIRKGYKYQLLEFDKSLFTWKILSIALAVYLFIEVISYFGVQIMYLEGATETANQAALIEGEKYQSHLYTILETVVLAPLAEEIVFRGIIFKKLFPKMQVLALIVSSLLFALAHTPTNIGSFIIYLAPGLALGYIYYKTNRLEYSIAAHAFNNLMVTIMFWLGIS